MNRDEIDQLLADELGGELAPSRRERLDGLLARAHAANGPLRESSL